MLMDLILKGTAENFSLRGHDVKNVFMVFMTDLRLSPLHHMRLECNRFSTVIFLSQINISLSKTISEGKKERKSKPLRPQIARTLNGTVYMRSQQFEK
jgi:hypothetical protein